MFSHLKLLFFGPSYSLIKNTKQLNSSDKHIELAHLTFRMFSTYIFKSNRLYPGLFYASYWNLPPRRATFLTVIKYDDQINGVAMGSPLGPVLANIFMCDCEEKWSMNTKISPSFWNWYTDDMFTMMFHNKDCKWVLALFKQLSQQY